MTRVLTVVAVWFVASIPASLAIGKALRGAADRYPLVGPDDETESVAA